PGRGPAGQAGVEAGPRRLRRLCRLPQRLEGDLVELDGLVVHAERRRALGGHPRVPDDLVPDLAAGEVVDELLGPLLEATGVDLLDRRTDQRVQATPLGLEQRGVGDVLGQRVLEDVLELAEAALLVDQLDSLELAQALLELLLEIGDAFEERQRELAADDGRRLHGPLLRVRESVQARDRKSTRLNSSHGSISY